MIFIINCLEGIEPLLLCFSLCESMWTQCTERSSCPFEMYLGNFLLILCYKSLLALKGGGKVGAVNLPYLSSQKFWMFKLSWWNNLQFPVSSLLRIVLQECQFGSVQPAVKIVRRTFEEKDCALSPCSQTCLPDTPKGKKIKAIAGCERNPQDCVLWGRQVEMFSVAEKLGQCQIKLQEPCSRHRFRWCRYWAQGAVTA